MPSWKKVITSGSNASLNSLYAPSITGSLLGTASYALTASYSNNLQISGSINNVNYIDFNTSASIPPYQNGRIFWDNTEGALSVYNSEADVTLQVGQENWTRVYNDTVATIANGAPVRIIGTHGDHPEVVLAASIRVSGSSNLVNQILGLATHDIEAGTFGYVTTQGLVRGVNTSAFNDGDTLYLSSSAGQLTSTVPSAPYEIVPVGQVVKASPGGSGIIYVAVQQPLDFTDLSSVALGLGTYQDGDIWTYYGPTKQWRHQKQLSGSYGITGSLSVRGNTGVNVLNTKTYTLRGSGPSASVDWESRTLNNTAGTAVLNWRTLQGRDANSKLSYEWNVRKLYDASATQSIDWRIRTAYDTLGTGSVLWNDRQLRDSSFNRSVVWSTRVTYDDGNRISIDWKNRQLINSSGTIAVLDWQTQRAFSTTTSQSIDWNNRILTDDGTPAGGGPPQTAVDWQNRALNDSVAVTSIDWAGRALYDPAGIPSIDYRGRDLLDSTGITALNYNITSNVSAVQQTAWTRALIDIPTVAEPLAYWSNYGKYLPTGEILASVTFDGSVVDYDLVGMREDGIWYSQDASSANVATKLLGLAFNVANGDNVLLEGTAVVASSSFGSAFPKVDKLQFGAPVYLNTTSSAGNYMSTTAPSLSGQFVRIIGHVYYRSTNDPDFYLIKFKPSHEWYEI